MATKRFKNGEIQIYVKVPAKSRKGLAYHKTWTLKGPGSTWTVTHIDTGLMVTLKSFGTEEEARDHALMLAGYAKLKGFSFTITGDAIVPYIKSLREFLEELAKTDEKKRAAIVAKLIGES